MKGGASNPTTRFGVGSLSPGNDWGAIRSYYVASVPDPVDYNPDGSKAAPFRTVQAALAKLAADYALTTSDAGYDPDVSWPEPGAIWPHKGGLSGNEPSGEIIIMNEVQVTAEIDIDGKVDTTSRRYPPIILRDDSDDSGITGILQATNSIISPVLVSKYGIFETSTINHPYYLKTKTWALGYMLKTVCLP